MSWQCFWVESTGEAELNLRRYVRADGGCSDKPYHNASVVVGRSPLKRNEKGYIEALDERDWADHPDWPVVCDCGYVFTDEDNRQVNQEDIYRASDGREWPHRSLPVGAMFDGWWNKPFGVGGDGIALTVVLPPEKPDSRSNWWHVDGPSRSNGVAGPGWTRTGDPRNPPTLTCNPSILTADYHGFLRAGVLTDPV